MEMIDVLNEDGTSTEKVASKKEVHEKGLWHKTAHVWFVNSQNEILVQKRADHLLNFPGYYDVSVAGHVSAGDTAKETARREIKEELGISVQENDLAQIGECREEVTQHNGTYINRHFNTVYVVKKGIPLEDFKIQESEVAHIEYVPLEKFKQWVQEEKDDLVMHKEEFKLLFDYLEKK